MDNISLSNALFSKVQQRVLGLLFGHPERSFYTSEIVKRVRSGSGAVDRELSRLLRSGLVTVERIGNQKHYRANRSSPIFHELQSLILKTVGLADPLESALGPFAGKIRFAFVYGSVAKGTDTARSDIDLMVVGEDLSYTNLYSALQNAEHLLGRPVNPNFLTVKDWQQRRADQSSFIEKVLSQPKIFIIGSESDLEA